jgi:hypothetical protein
MQRLIDRLIGTDVTDVHEPVPEDVTVLVFEEMKRSLTDQQTQFAQINARASYIFTGASITAAFQSLFWIGSDAFSANSLWSVPLLVLFLGLTYAIVQAFRNPGLSIAFEPSGLATYVSMPASEVRLELMGAAQQIHAVNAIALARKAVWMNRAEALLIAEIGYLLVIAMTRADYDFLGNLLRDMM